MKRVIIYGIKNCDTMKKALLWLNEHQIDFTFHDYKKDGACEKTLHKAIADHGWETVINRRGTTWKKLPDNVKNSMDETNAIAIAIDNLSLIKRPLLAISDKTYLGFKPDHYQQIFGK